MKLNAHGQPAYESVSLKFNKEKALLALRGMLEGMNADSRLNPLEVTFLDNWLKTDVKYIDDGDILDLRDLVAEVLADGEVTVEELAELKALITDVLDYGEGTASEIDGLTNQLLGFLKGITADSIVNRQEVMALKALLEENSELIERWPGDLINKRLTDILADDIITDEEARDLYDMLAKIGAQTFQETGLATGMATQYLSDDPDEIDLKGCLVCFTGQFPSGSRSKQERIAAELGATPQKTVTQKTDCLVLGTMASRDWKFSSYGRKIQSVLENRKKGSNTLIISEQCWCRIAGY